MVSKVSWSFSTTGRERAAWMAMAGLGLISPEFARGTRPAGKTVHITAMVEALGSTFTFVPGRRA